MNLKLHSVLPHLLIFVGIVLSRVDLLLTADIATGDWDSVTRIALAYTTKNSLYEWLFPSSVWLPLHTWFVRLSIFLTNSLNSIIYLNTIFTSLSFSILYRIFKKNYKGNSYIIVIFLITISTIPSILYTSVTTLTEPMAMLAIVLIYYFYRQTARSKLYLIMFASSSVLFNFLRYEIWVYTFLLAFFIIYNNPHLNYKKKAIIVFFIIFVPVGWTINGYIDTQQFFLFLRIVKNEGVNLLQKHNVSFYEYFHDGWWSSLLYFIIMLPLFFLQKKKQFLLNTFPLFLFLLICLFMLIYLNPLTSPRYFIIPTIITTIILMEKIGSGGVLKAKEKLLIMLISLIIDTTAFHFRHDKIYLFEDFRKPGNKEGISYLKQLDISDNNKIFIARELWYPELIAIELGIVNTNKLLFSRGEDQFPSYELGKGRLIEFYKNKKVFSNEKIGYVVFLNNTLYSSKLINAFHIELEKYFNLIWYNNFIYVFKRDL